MVTINRLEKNLVKLILLFPLIIVISAIFKIDVRLAYIEFFVLNMVILASKDRKGILVLLITNFLVLIQITLLRNMVDLNELMLFSDFILIIVYSYRRKSINIYKEIIEENKKLAFILSIIILLVFSISFISGSGWINVWEGLQFVGVISFPHDACYFFVGMQFYFVLFYYMFNKKIIKNICIVANTMFFIFALFTNARTPFILSAFIFIYFLHKLSYKKYILIYFTITIPLSLMLIALILNKISYEFLYNLPIINKFIVTIQRGNFTSSRDVIWERIINSYNTSFNLIDKLIGKGTGFSQSINYAAVGKRLWAHNDFLETLVCTGYYGLSVYLYTLVLLAKKIKSKIFILVFIFVAFTNGIFVYRQIVVFIPIIFILLDNNKLCKKDKAVR